MNAVDRWRSRNGLEVLPGWQLIKQPANAYGPETLEKLRTSFEQSNFNVQKLAGEIVRIAALQGIGKSNVKITSAN